MPEEEKKVPKKRGRKPKPVDPNKVVEKKIPKKRGRKPKEKYSANNNTPVKHEENYILHIPTKTESNIVLEENNPKPFSDLQENYSITEQCETIEDTTEKVCMWCCHTFSSPPWSTPYIHKKKCYTTYGQYCSPECVCAYNFDDSNLTDDKKWHIYSMINSLAREMYDDRDFICKLAPPRNSLKMFGGKFTIDDFRSISLDKNREIKIYLPPVISILHNVEEFQDDIVSCNLKNNIMLLQDERYKTINNNLKLKREKPLLNKKNTLEHCMNIEIS